MKHIFIFILTFYSFGIIAQNVGNGTTTPKARLHVADSAVVFTGATNLPINPRNPPISGVGVRMMWYPDKAAFRAGLAIGNSWDAVNVGKYSAAFNSTKKLHPVLIIQLLSMWKIC